METVIFDRDINQAIFDTGLDCSSDGTTILYFNVPKEWLGEKFDEAIGAVISVEYPTAHPEAVYATVNMSPLRVSDTGYLECFNWGRVKASPTEIETLIALAGKGGVVDSNGGNIPS